MPWGHDSGVARAPVPDPRQAAPYPAGQVVLQLQACSRPDSATEPAKVCQEAGGTLPILIPIPIPEMFWREGYSWSCGRTEGHLGLSHGWHLGTLLPPHALPALGSVQYVLIKGSSDPV